MDRLHSQAAPARARFRTGFVAVATALVVSGICALASRASWASDHEDAPSLVSDPGADIADVHAFMRPGGDTTHLVLSMTVHPNADTTTMFDANVEYAFQIFGYDPLAQALDPTLSAEVSCRFQLSDDGKSETVLCDANGFSVFGTAFATDAGSPTDDVRIFAGLRADPAFGDITALQDTLGTGTLALKDAGGTNTFAGKNVLSLVVEIDVDQVLFGGNPPTTRPLLAVSGSTERL